MHKDQNGLAQAGAVLGIGLIAGLAGTAAVTLSKKLDKRYNEGRETEQSVLEIASKVLDIEPSSEAKRGKVVEEVHWAYGASLGMIRGALCFLGLRGWKATALHFAIIWYGEKIVLPDLKLAFPDIEGTISITEEDPQKIARESMHQAIYAITTGVVFDAITAKH